MNTCLTCGKVLKGRTDKKFCHLACRNNHHNSLQRRKNKIVRHVLRKLLLNRRLLLQQLGNNSFATITMENLLEKGFEPQYITQWNASSMQCFDAIIEIQNDGLVIIRLADAC